MYFNKMLIVEVGFGTVWGVEGRRIIFFKNGFVIFRVKFIIFVFFILFFVVVFLRWVFFCFWD